MHLKVRSCFKAHPVCSLYMQDPVSRKQRSRKLVTRQHCAYRIAGPRLQNAVSGYIAQLAAIFEVCYRLPPQLNRLGFQLCSSIANYGLRGKEGKVLPLLLSHHVNVPGPKDHYTHDAYSHGSKLTYRFRPSPAWRHGLLMAANDKGLTRVNKFKHETYTDPSKH
jgi:hypothetical protein